MKGKDDGYKVFFSNSYADPDIGSGNADDIGVNRGKRGYECQLHPQGYRTSEEKRNYREQTGRHRLSAPGGA